MSATNKFNASTHAKFQALVNAISALLPSPAVTGTTQTFSGFDLSGAPGFTLTLAVSADGQNLNITTKSDGAGQNNAFGAADGGVGGHYLRTAALKVPGSSMP